MVFWKNPINKSYFLKFDCEDVSLSKQMEYFISTHHWLDAMTPPVGNHINFLAETVFILLSRLSPSFGTISNENSDDDLNGSISDIANFNHGLVRLRGGFWLTDYMNDFRCASRISYDPFGRSSDLGFRCVMT